MTINGKPVSNWRFKGHPDRKEILRLAIYGDEALSRSLCELLDNPCICEYKHEINNYLQSNEFLSKIEIPVRFKRLKRSHRTLHERADLAEVYIWWLYDNFGKEAVQRFIVRELKRLKWSHNRALGKLWTWVKDREVCELVKN